MLVELLVVQGGFWGEVIVYFSLWFLGEMVKIWFQGVGITSYFYIELVG